MKKIKLQEMLKEFDDDTEVMCGFEGLSFYKHVGNGKHDFVGRIDFENEKRRAQKILDDKNYGFIGEW